MNDDKSTVDAELAKRQRIIDDLAASVSARITAADRGEDTHMGGGALPRSHKMATEGELRAAEIAAAEARTDTKIVRMEGKLDLVLSKLDGVREDNRGTRANQWIIGVSLAVLIVAIAGLFPVFFGIGTQVRDLVHSEIQSQSPQPPNAPK
jgi:hypothetical protein